MQLISKLYLTRYHWIITLACCLVWVNGYPAQAEGQGKLRPNILWITSEDNGPHLGCYGDEYATSPHLDKLASKSLLYLNCWSTAPVCAPARTTIISGMYPPCLGAEHMRSMVKLPKNMLMYPQYLKQAGYYCTNNSKEDYNLEKPGKVWDASNRKAHWKNRKPGQPFFSIFNITVSHESRLRIRPHQQVHDPAKVRVPAYHPDTPEVRQDWAQYYDKVTEMDAIVGKYLKELHNAGLNEDTIVFYYGDHGSGMPRSKRWPYNSGLSVPLIVHIPEKFQSLAPDDYKMNGKSNRLVGFIDLAPTLLSLAGIKPPAHMQGHAFMGDYEAAPQKYQFGFRGRMDERYDLLRSVRNQRYIYIRNYMPHKIYGQYLDYMFKTPTTQVWHQLYHAGKLKPPQTYFWEPKPAEELYDLQTDPDEVHNLITSPEHQHIRNELRTAQQELAVKIRDIGFLPENEYHTLKADMTPYEFGHNEQRYPIQKVIQMAELASSGKQEGLKELQTGLKDRNTAVRYWAALGMLMRGQQAVSQSQNLLRQALLNDSSESVRCIAAEALGKYGTETDVNKSVDTLVQLGNFNKHGLYVAMLALNSLDQLGAKAKRQRDAIAKLPIKPTAYHSRMRNYVNRLVTRILEQLDHN